MLTSKKFFATTLLAASVVFIATVAMKTEPKADPIYKNLKVLPKDISKQDLDKVMDEWRDALGVRCGFCHARDNATGRNDFASDAKPEKEACREMYKMTAKINADYFKPDKDDKTMTAAITCYVCHHGTAHPESVAPPRQNGQGGFGQNFGPPPIGGGLQGPPPAGSTTTPPAKTPPGR